MALTLAVLGFKQSATEGTLFGLASSLGFTFLLSQLVRDSGKARELWLFEKWGGKPSIAMLRHISAVVFILVLWWSLDSEWFRLQSHGA
jgi:hypothetical protein